jgi:DNA topoisomerase 2-associated protein PAT1
VLAPNFLYLFPSYRITGDTAYTAALPADVDSRAWQFLAVFATLAHHDARPALVTGLRDKILADLAATRVDWVPDEGERTARLANLNLFLNSLGLDSSQIAM